MNGQSCSSLFCSLGKSTQPLNLNSHRFKEHQPNNPQLFGKAGCFQHQLPQGTTQFVASYKSQSHNPVLPQPDRAGTPRGMEGTVEPIIPMSDPKAAVGGAAGGLGRQFPGLSLGQCAAKGVCCNNNPQLAPGRVGRICPFPSGKGACFTFLLALAFHPEPAHQQGSPWAGFWLKASP